MFWETAKIEVMKGGHHSCQETELQQGPPQCMK